MAEEKVDMSLVGGDSSREGGTGIGLANVGDAKSAEAGFMNAAEGIINELDGLETEEQPKPKRRRKKKAAPPPEELIDDGESLEGEAEPEGVEQQEEEEEAPDEGAEAEEDDDDGEETRVSIRLNGKKASLEDVLDNVGATVVVNGEELEVTGDELIKGYQRGKDYSQTTTELKHARDELIPYNQMVSYAKEDPQFLSYVQSYFQNGPYPELTNNPLLRTSDADLAKLLDQDNAAYDPKQAQDVINLRTAWQEKMADRNQIDQRAAQDFEQRKSAWIQEQVQEAQDVINQLGLDVGNEYKEGETEYAMKSQQVVEFLAASGYNEAEIMGTQAVSATDARAAILAYKAAEYDRMIRESDSPRVTLGKKRKRLTPPRSQKAGTGTRRTTTSKRQQRDSFRKASKSQKSDDWVSALAQRLS